MNSNRTQVVVVGTGAAGLSTLLHLAAANIDTIAITRASITDSATAWAQGGISAVWDAADSIESHVQDTLTAGAGMCDESVVRELVRAAPESVQRLIELGAKFDTAPTGALDLHLEGGHSHRRIIHADGAATGAEIERALWAALSRALEGSSIRIMEHARLVDVLSTDGRTTGIRALGQDGLFDIHADAVVLATGGLGQLWPVTSNPATATGDGVAAALRAGATLRDVEFVQFHPTVLADANASSRGVLISEAVRGEGALLVDGAGNRIMAGIHPLADLAPRDVVSAAIIAHLEGTREPHAFLDATHFGAKKWESHFPGILELCRGRGIDPVRQFIPVHPAAHYSCGGVAATLNGVTTVEGLYAVGEVAATGLHGANRLASNSLTEALVMGDRLGRLLTRDTGTDPAAEPDAQPVPEPGTPRPVACAEPVPARSAGLRRSAGPRSLPSGPHHIVAPSTTPTIRAAMEQHAFVSRDAAGLRALQQVLAQVPTTSVLTHGSLTATNLHLLASAIATAAHGREESRGTHRRADFPAQSPPYQLLISMGDDGLTCSSAPLTPAERTAA